MAWRGMGVLLVVAAVAAGGCGKKKEETGGPTGPNTSTTTTVPANRPPTVTSMNVSPAFGISEVSPFSGSASASDPDGDPVSYLWQVGSSQVSGTSFNGTIRGDGSLQVLLTVSDGRGGTASDTRTVVVGSMAGSWNFSLTGACTGTLQFSLTQTGGTVAGTSFYPQTFCGVPGGTSGRTDPAVQNTIDAAGNIVVREKASIFSDWTFRGQMDSTGRRITGSYGPPSGLFTATK